jgi:RNA polymerase sigma-70 factor (sigma-E family)
VTSDVADFDAFYHAHFGSTVVMTFGLTADRSEAQDIAQEAFCRAWQRWSVISAYDNPLSWVRRVATNLALSRWRKLKVAANHLVHHRPEDAPELIPDRIDLIAALRDLPVVQRKAVVLHYLLDLPVQVVAEELEVSVGTVKSWLHRGRATLSTSLADDVRRITVTPVASAVRGVGDRRTRRRRTGTVAGVILAIMAVSVAGLVILRARQQHPMPITPTPSSSPSATVAVTWRVAELDSTGTKLTVFLDPPDRCHTLSHPQAEIRYSSNSVDVAAFAQLEDRTECFDFGGGAPVTVTMSSPLGARDVFDGSADHTARLICRRALLPKLPAAWKESPGPGDGWGVTSGWFVSYDLENSGTGAQIVAQFPPSPRVGEPLTVGGQRGTLYPRADTYSFVWRPAGDTHDYRIVLEPAEGGSISKQQFINILNSFAWPR